MLTYLYWWAVVNIVVILAALIYGAWDALRGDE